MVKVSELKMRSYNGDYRKEGEFAERVALAYFEKDPNVIGVTDFRNLRPFHDADIDFGLSLIDGTSPYVEIKSDKHLGISGHVLFEVLRFNHTCVPERVCVLGWSARSPATYFTYYASKKKQLCTCKAQDLRRAFQEYTRIARKKTRFVWVNTDIIKSTYCALIPWLYCKDIFTIKDVSDIVEALITEDQNANPKTTPA